jgi:hypothetical protein
LDLDGFDMFGDFKGFWDNGPWYCRILILPEIECDAIGIIWWLIVSLRGSYYYHSCHWEGKWRYMPRWQICQAWLCVFLSNLEFLNIPKHLCSENSQTVTMYVQFQNQLSRMWAWVRIDYSIKIFNLNRLDRFEETIPTFPASTREQDSNNEKK